MKFSDTLCMIWVKQAGDKMELDLDPVKDAPPYDRPLLARLLRDLADQIDAQSQRSS